VDRAQFGGGECQVSVDTCDVQIQLFEVAAERQTSGAEDSKHPVDGFSEVDTADDRLLT
jgi:hypothetical protein